MCMTMEKEKEEGGSEGIRIEIERRKMYRMHNTKTINENQNIDTRACTMKYRGGYHKN
jgi:hypothetical protein